MFIPCTDKQGTAYFEFQYCKKDWNIKKILKNGYSFWEKDSLLVHIDNDKKFFDNYLKYFELTNAPNGKTVFCYYGVNYYTKEQTVSILERINTDKPNEYQVLIKWLEKAISDYNGFFFIGI